MQCGGVPRVSAHFLVSVWSCPFMLQCCSLKYHIQRGSGKEAVNTHLMGPRLWPRTMLCWTLTCICLLSLALVPGSIWVHIFLWSLLLAICRITSWLFWVLAFLLGWPLLPLLWQCLWHFVESASRRSWPVAKRCFRLELLPDNYGYWSRLWPWLSTSFSVCSYSFWARAHSCLPLLSVVWFTPPAHLCPASLCCLISHLTCLQPDLFSSA